MPVKYFKINQTKEVRMKCPMMGGSDWFAAMMALKIIIAVWILIIPLFFLRRFDKLLEILEDKKK